MELKEAFKKFWYLLWEDDSFKGWLLSIIFIFVFIKFIFFPVLTLVTGTSLPLAIVESCSMYHEGNLFSDIDSWWEKNRNKYSEFSINESNFQNFPMKKGFNKGDILFIVGTDPNKLDVGDVIVFNANQQHPVIHRIVKIDDSENEKIFSTFGDNNNGQLSFEKEITEEKVIGKALFRAAPYLGWVKLSFFEWKKNPNEKGFCN
ncbi:MAG: signal peptidase I [Candidatus Pacearchaeota archaeon]